MDRNRLIGSNGGLPWHMPTEMQYFKSVTMGKVLIMGRLTYESIGKPLPGRISIVVTSSAALAEDQAQAQYIREKRLFICSSLDAALETARAVIEGAEELNAPDSALVEVDQNGKNAGSASTLLHPEAAIIGGAQLCKAGMAVTDRLYLTRIDATFEGDTWLDSYQPEDWQQVSVKQVEVDGYPVSYMVLERK